MLISVCIKGPCDLTIPRAQVQSMTATGSKAQSELKTVQYIEKSDHCNAAYNVHSIMMYVIINVKRF